MNSNFSYVYTEFDTREREIAPGVYLVSTEYWVCLDDQEQLAEGDDLYIYMDYSVAKKILTHKAIMAGDAEGTRLYYSAPFRYIIPLHELFANHCLWDAETERLGDANDMAKDGKFFCPDYFGELESPEHTCGDQPVRHEHISNGIDAYQYSDGGLELTVHETAAFYELSALAEAFGVRKGCFLHYKNETCAIPVYEIAETHPDLKVLVDDEMALHDILSKNFSSYLQLCTGSMPTSRPGL